MAYAGPIIENITGRVVGETAPDETYTFPVDLTGHTVHMVFVDADGVEVDSIAGDITPGASSSGVSFTITAEAVATAGVFTYSVILDIASPSARRTDRTGDWVVTDYPG